MRPMAPAGLLGATLVLSGCGYALVGRGVNPPTALAGVETIAVLPFDNRTQRPEIDQFVTEEVAREFAKRRAYRIVTDGTQAQAVLEGVVTSYRYTPVQFNEEGRYTRVESIVTLQATIRDSQTDQVLWSQAGLVFRDQWDVPEAGEFFDEETLALERIARGAAAVLVSSLVEGF